MIKKINKIYLKERNILNKKYSLDEVYFATNVLKKYVKNAFVFKMVAIGTLILRYFSVKIFSS